MPSLVLNGAHCSSGTCVTCCVLLGCLNMLKQTCWSGSPKLTVSVTTVKLLPRLLTHHESEGYGGYGSKPCVHWWTSKFWCMTGCSFMPFPSTYVFICFTRKMMYNLWKKVGYSAILAANLRAAKLRLPVPLAATFQFQSLLGHLLTLELLLKGLSSTVRGCHGRKTAWRHVFSGSEPHWHHWSVQTISNMFKCGFPCKENDGKWWYDMTCIPFECFPLLGLAVSHVQAARSSKSQQAKIQKYPDALVPSCSIFLAFHPIIKISPAECSTFFSFGKLVWHKGGAHSFLSHTLW